MIETKNLVKSFNGARVLDNVSVTIPRGQITSFIGPNGAGKTTLLNVICRLLSAESGSVIIDGRDLGDWSSNELARKISILKQSNFVSLRLSVKDLVGFGRFPYSQGRLNREDDKVIERSMHYLGIAELRDKRLDELSGGQRQRAFIAMVVAQDTDYILLDEPLNNLDMRRSAEMMRILRQLTAELDKTVALVLHDINYASVHSDRIIALKDGRVVKHGNVDEMIDASVLNSIFDIDFQIKEMYGHKICIYY